MFKGRTTVLGGAVSAIRDAGTAFEAAAGTTLEFAVASNWLRYTESLAFGGLVLTAAAAAAAVTAAFVSRDAPAFCSLASALGAAAATFGSAGAGTMLVGVALDVAGAPSRFVAAAP